MLDEIDRDLELGVPPGLVGMPVPPGWPLAGEVLRAFAAGLLDRPVGDEGAGGDGAGGPVADVRLVELERQRLARELHDETGQLLAVCLIQVDAALAAVPESEPKLRARLEQVRGTLLDTWHGVRRIAHRLRPPMLDDAGLVPTLRWLAQRFQADHGIPVTLEVDGDADLPKDLELAVYRIVQESLTNVARHARARSVRVALGYAGDTVTCRIDDDGSGFEVARVVADPTRLNLGLRGMCARARQFGGEVRIESEPGRGTRVEASLRNVPPRPGGGSSAGPDGPEQT